MPKRTVDRATNFIVEEESWSVVEYDHTSVPGIMYLSLTEGKINEIYDDVENNLADTDKLANYDLSLPETIQTFKVGEPITPTFTLTKNGVPCDLEVTLLPTDKKITRLINGVLTAVGPGRTEITVQLKDYPVITLSLTIEVGEAEQEFTAYIEGQDKIRLNREATYTLVGTDSIEGSVRYVIDGDAEIATIDKSQTAGAVCVIKANGKNKLGDIVLLAVYNSKIYTKNISIVPLW